MKNKNKNNKYISYQEKNRIKDIDNKIKGIPFDDLKNYSIRLPIKFIINPNSEQERKTMINDIDNLINNIETNIILDLIDNIQLGSHIFKNSL